MSQLPFILGAYGVTIAATLTLAALSLRAMRRAEREADALRSER
jgi:hypothetical protein